MATPASAKTLTDGLKANGVRYVGHGTWQTHNRGTRGDGWGPVNGIVIHHFGPYSTLTGAVDLAYRGRSDLPGPLYHALVSRDGVAHLIGWGRVNHAGLGDGQVLKHVIAEDMPYPRPAHNNTDGNARFYGICMLNSGDGHETYPDAQIRCAARMAAVLLHHHGWTEKSVIGHKEWEVGKPDPSTGMDDFRRRVAAELKHV